MMSSPNSMNAGVYPMLPDDTWFLAADFDKKSWIQDVDSVSPCSFVPGLAPGTHGNRQGGGAGRWPGPKPGHERMSGPFVWAGILG
jgi:hypothetical protein